MSEDRGPSVTVTEYALMVALVIIVALITVGIASSDSEASATDEVPSATSVVNSERYKVEDVGTVTRWEDPEHNVVCWSVSRATGVSCIPKSQLAPFGPTVVPQDK